MACASTAFSASGFGFLRAGLHELDAEHRALAAHLADDRRIARPSRRCAPSSACSTRCASASRSSLLDHVEHREGRRGGDRVAAEGAADAAGLDRIHDLGAAGDRREREAARDALGARDQVGHDAVVLDRVPGAGAADAGLDLVGDEDDAVLGAELARAARSSRAPG